MSKRRTKSSQQVGHAKRRSRERHGISLSDHDYQEIIKKIQNGESEFLEKQTIRVSVHRVEYKDEMFIAVYDKHRKSISTFLPNAYMEKFSVGEDL